MFSHEQIWGAIDHVAKRHNLTPSALAKRAGLDATSFNKSKRIAPDGRKRWPSTETLSKVLKAVNMDLQAFASLLATFDQQPRRLSSSSEILREAAE